MTTVLSDRLSKGLLLAPLVFVVHWLEESPSFVPWFNAHVASGITQELFWSVNLAGLLITLVMAACVWISRSAAALVLSVAWLSFLMLANGIFHVTAAVVDRAYVPGLATAVLLYFPYCVWLGTQVVRSRPIPVSVAALSAVLGGLPMAVHGYRIVFLGSRLF